MNKTTYPIRAKQSCLPHLDYLCKQKKHYKKLDQKQNALKEDVDDVIATLAKQPSPCNQKLKHLKKKYFESKLNFRITNFTVERLSHSMLPEDIKNIKAEVNKYIQRLQLPEVCQKNDYNAFIRLSQESQDYLQFYLKHHFKTTSGNDLLHQHQKTIILSLLKNHYKCLTQNPPQIANRILLSLEINPLNDFHFITWHQFSRFRKMATQNCTKAEIKAFLVEFFIPKIEKKGTKQEFWAILGAILRKLEKVISKSNVDRLIQRVEMTSVAIIPQQLTRKQLQRVITNQPLFLWEQLAKLVFLI